MEVDESETKRGELPAVTDRNAGSKESAWAARRRLRLVMHTAPNAMLLADSAGCILSLNTKLAELFGYFPEELISQSVDLLLPTQLRDRHRALRDGYSHAARARQMSPKNEVVGLRKNGAEVTLELGLYPVVTDIGTWILASVVDVSARKRAEVALASALAQRDSLLREANHRVRNNLQIVMSMLSLQSMSSEDEDLRHSLRECRDRVLALVLVQEKLCRVDAAGLVDFADYSVALAQYLFDSRGIRSSRVRLHLEMEDARLSTETAMSCGTILSEVLTHALTHRFANDAGGNIRVSLTRIPPQRWSLSVTDELEEEPAASGEIKRSSIGPQLIEALAKQMDGVVSMDVSHGTRFSLEFSERRYTARV